MSYTPNNAYIYTAAFAGVMAGRGVFERDITQATTYVLLAQVAGAWAQAYDTEWASATANELDVQLTLEFSAAYWDGRSIQSTTSVNPSDYLSIASALITAIQAGESYFSGQGITPPDINNGSSSVADDIAKSDGVTINRVRGFRDVPLIGSDGDTPPIGGTWIYDEVGTDGFKPDNPVIRAMFDPMHYGASGNGIADDSVVLSEIAALGPGTVYFGSGTYRIANSISFPSNQTLLFSDGAKLFIDSGKTVTVNGHVKARLTQQIFSGLGKIIFTSAGSLCAAWWPMPMNGIDDDAPAIQAAIESIPLYYGASILLPPTPYGINAPWFATTVNVTRPVIIKGSAATGGGVAGTFIRVAQGVTAFIVQPSSDSSDGGSGSGCRFEDFSLLSTQLVIPRYQTNHIYPPGSYAATVSLDIGSDVSPDAVEPRFYLYTLAGGTTGNTEPVNPGYGYGAGIGPGHTVTDSGGVVWEARVHCGIYAKETCYWDGLTIVGFTNAAFHYQASVGYTPPSGPSGANGGGGQRSQINQCGVGISATGTDVNGPVFSDIQIVDTGYNFYGSGAGVPTMKGAAAIYEDSDLGCRYLGITIDTVRNGRSVYASGASANSAALFLGIHTEGASYLNYIGSPVMWVGGPQNRFSFTTNTSGIIRAASYQSASSWQNDSALSGVTYTLRIGQENGPTAFMLSTSDSSDVVALEYGYGAVAGKWSYIARGIECFGFTTIEHAGLGGGVVLLPNGFANGKAPQWYDFTDVTQLEAHYIRGASRLIGDRVQYQALVEGVGSAVEKIVITDGFEGYIWVANAVRVPSVVFRPTPNNVAANYRFICTVGGVTGNSEPVWDTTIGHITIDGTVHWQCLGVAPEYAGLITEEICDAKQSISTTDATANIVCASYPIRDGETRVITSQIVATESTGIGSPDSYFEERRIVVRRNGGSLSVVMPDSQLAIQANANGLAWSTTLQVNGTAVEHVVTGASSKNIDWVSRAKSLSS